MQETRSEKQEKKVKERLDFFATLRELKKISRKVGKAQRFFRSGG